MEDDLNILVNGRQPPKFKTNSVKEQHSTFTPHNLTNTTNKTILNQGAHYATRTSLEQDPASRKRRVNQGGLESTTVSRADHCMNEAKNIFEMQTA